MAPKKMHAKRHSVNTILKFTDGLNHHPNLDHVNDCPEALKPILVLINQTRLGYGDLNPELEGQEFNASHIYEKQLMWRAQQMSQRCSKGGVNKQSEFEWQTDMTPHAFLSLNNVDEEWTHSERPYHHCLACCRVFRPGSRPLVDTGPNATAQSNAEAILEAADPSQICDGNEHFNLPNFVLKPQLRYYYQEEEDKWGIPDATIGLCGYNFRNEPWQTQRPDLRTNPRVQPFSRGFLKTIFSKYEDLKGPYPLKVLDDGVPLFAFALWEAKKSDGVDTHYKAFTQLDNKVRRLLQWQDAVINEAESDSNEFSPVVWAFTSVGSSWTVYGCYQSFNKPEDKNFASSVELWSGNVSDKNKALQFLWIVDIIKFWAEYTYKPMIGACLARLKAEVDKAEVDTHEEVPLEETLWKSHITLNEKNTPWFFHLANLPLPKRSPPHNSSSSGDRRPKLKPKSLSDPCFPSSPDTAPEQILHRTLTLDEQQIDDFSWLQVRDPGHGDILAIRVGREGKVDKPLVLLDSTINDNTAQYSEKVLSHAGVDVVLIKEGERLSYLLQKRRSLFTSNHQFCAILPLEPKAYEGQRQNGSRASIFEPLEELLDLESFYRIYDLECSSHANRKRPQVEDRLNEESDEEHNAENHRGSCDEDTSDEEAGTGSEYDSIGDFFEEEAEEGEEEEVDEEDVDDEDADADADDDADDDDDDDDDNDDADDEDADNDVDDNDADADDDDDDDDDEPTTDKDELNIPGKLDQRLENLHKAWHRHKWPSEKRQIITFARVACRVQFAQQKAYNVKNGDFYRQVGEGPSDWKMPVEGFGKSFFRVIRTEKRSSLNSKLADGQSYKDFDTGPTLNGSHDKGKKAVKVLGSKFKSLGVK